MMILKTSRSNLSSNDQLSLDLPFAATKSLTARVGPTPSFTRASGATYIGSDGLIHGVDTSTTSNTIGTGSRTFTLTATAGQDQLWRTGDAVDASNGSNSMVGTVTSYTAATQVLVCNMTTTSGSGTFTSWRIGYRGPRFDHTSAGVCRGLLIEESRTNLLTQSGTWSSGSSFTGPSAPTVTQDTTSAPDGALTADTLTGATGTDTAGNINSTWRPPTVSSSTAYTFSIYVRSLGVATKAEIRIRDNSTGASVQTLDTTLTSSWKRLSVTATTGATTTSIRCIIQNTDGPIAIWGAQLEAGSYATSYIPTTTGSVVRSSDVCSITEGGFTSFSSTAGFTALCDFSFLATATAGAMSPIAVNQSSANGVFLYKYLTSSEIAVYHVSTNTSIGSITANFTNKAAMAYDGDSVVGVLSGGAVSVETGSTALSFTGMTIGSNRSSNHQMSGHIAAIRYYKKRLPDAKLQALTV
jgi:hypothetical protein